MRLSHAVLAATGMFLADFSAASAAQVTTYAGTLGKASIIIELQAPGKDGAFFGRYAYMSKGIDIPLHGMDVKGSLTLEEEKACTDELCKDADDKPIEKAPIGAQWQLTGNETELSGTWTDKETGKSLPIKLVKKAVRDVTEEITSAEKLDPAYSPAMQGEPSVVTEKDIPYDFLKMQYPLKQGKVVRIGNSAYRMDFDPRSELDYPVVTKLVGENPALLNAWLAQQRLQWSSTAFGCLASRYLGMGWTGWGGEGTNGFDDGAAKVTVDYLTPRLMSLTESGVRFCSEAHFSPFNDHRLADPRTGRPIEVKDLLRGWIARDAEGTVVDPVTVADKSTLYWGPDDDLTKFVLDHRDQVNYGDDTQCQLSDNMKTSLDMYVKGDNLVFAFTGLIEAAAYACAEDLAVVPIKDARPLLTEAGVKYFVELDK
jgi:hypothetical protein